MKIEKDDREMEWQKLQIKMSSLESLEIKIDRELEALLIKRLNNNESLPIKELFKIQQLNKRGNKTIESIVFEMATIVL